MLIQIKNWKTFETIFELDKENNTIKDTVEEAVRRGVNLSHADFSCATLKGADLHGAKLYNASFANANLEGANLRCADLTFANIIGANLSCADLSSADLRDSKLSGADLELVNITNANLTDADLICATIKGADLSGADLSGANIKYAWLDNVILDNTIMPDFPMVCPDKGSFIGYKKIWRSKKYNYQREFIVKLEIPEDAKRSSSTTSKCRCSKAKVLEIKDMKSGETINEITNINEKPCTYKVGEYVYPDSFDECRWHECSNGIHFFMNEYEALEY